MKVRFAEKKDIPLLKELWIEAFGSEEREFCSAFYEAVFDKIRCFVIEEDEEILSMLHSVDCVLYNTEGKKSSYLYAVATKKQYRGRGLFSRLFEAYTAFLRENGYFYSIVIPHGDHLFGFYEKFSYKRFFKRAFVNKPNGERTELTEKSVQELYTAYLEDIRRRSLYVEKDFDAFRLSLMDKSIYTNGSGIFIVRDDGCAEYYGGKSEDIDYERLEDNALILCLYDGALPTAGNEREKIMSFFMN